MDLTKIAELDMTYLEKTAALVDGFATGEISGEQADELAKEAGIALSDLENTFHAAYGEDDQEDELGKFAAADGTYLQKTAEIVDAFAAGDIDAEYAQELAKVAGIATDDLESVLAVAYDGEGEVETEFSNLEKIAGDENSTYLAKCASIADTFAAGEISGEDADQIAQEIGVDPSDVFGVYTAAYELDKEAGVMDAPKAAFNFTKRKAGELKDGVKNFYKKDFNEIKRGQRGIAGAKGDDAVNSFKSARNKAAAKLAGKAVGTAGAVGATGYGATKLFGGKKDDK